MRSDCLAIWASASNRSTKSIPASLLSALLCSTSSWVRTRTLSLETSGEQAVTEFARPDVGLSIFLVRGVEKPCLLNTGVFSAAITAAFEGALQDHGR